MLKTVTISTKTNHYEKLNRDQMSVFSKTKNILMQRFWKMSAQAKTQRLDVASKNVMQLITLDYIL